MSRVPMTLEGESLLRKELQKLKFEDRINISKAIASARELGDLKENAEYHAAKEQQGLIESRIRDIQFQLANSQVIDICSIEPNGKVLFGVTVELENIEKKSNVTYKIVGQGEADVTNGKISVLSPISRGLMGKSVGEIINIEAPNGIVSYEIISVKHI